MITVDEEQVGTDATEIAYPNISSCMSITLYLEDGSLIGTHLTKGTFRDKVNQAFAVMDTMLNRRPIKKIYLVGRTAEWSSPRSGDDFRWPTFAATVKTYFPAYTGRVFSYNSGSVSNDTLVRMVNTSPMNPPAHLRIKISKTGLYTLTATEDVDISDRSRIDLKGGRTVYFSDEYIAAHPEHAVPAVRTMVNVQRFELTKQFKPFTTVKIVDPDRLTVH